MKPARSATRNDKTSLTKIALFALLAFVAFTIADLGLIYFRELLIPNQAPPKKTMMIKPPAFVNRNQFSAITNRNLFSATGLMPDAITLAKTKGEAATDAPTASQLPINILGTLVHSDPRKSIVALEIKSKNMTGSYSTGADIEGLAKIEKIERNIVYIRNNSSGALEYIEMNKASNKVAFGASKTEVTKPGKEVQSTGNNTFAIKRSDLLKYTNDLSSVLMQARAVPNRDPNTGEVNGFRVLDMQPGSIYEQLGMQKMDVIKGVNGEPVDSIQKAMEMYNTLKNGNQVKMQIERGGKTETFVYDIK